jgi:hypothetical protein
VSQILNTVEGAKMSQILKEKNEEELLYFVYL